MIIKSQLGHRKARYRGLAKNTCQLLVMFALSNLWMCASEFCGGCRHECVCSKGKGPKTGANPPNKREIGGKFSAGFIMRILTHQLALWRGYADQP